MPLYDYRCSACGRKVEVMHGIYASGPSACEVCGGAMVKMLSAPTIHFKGSGWAKKDAATAASRKSSPAKEDKPTKPGETKSSEGTSAAATGKTGGEGPASSTAASSTSTKSG